MMFWKNIWVRVLIRDIFQSLLLGYLFILLIESWKLGITDFIVNKQKVLLALVIVGACFVVLEKDQHTRFPSSRYWNFFFALALGAVGTVFIFLKLKEFGFFGILTSVMSGVLLISLSFLLTFDQEER